MKLHRELTMVLPHFQNLGMWAEQQRIWRDYPAALRERLHVVLVDDCSPEGSCPTPASVTVEGLASLRIYRLTEKTRWNWLACRNLGAKEATTDWLLLTDIDHGLPAETLATLLNLKLDKHSAYRFRRVTATKPWPYELADCPDYKMHNDSWLLTRDLFFSEPVGGYDERLSGCYGTSGEFRDRVIAATKTSVALPNVLIRYPREVIADASTPPSVYTRKGDPENDNELQRRKDARALEGKWRPLHGLTPWVQVYATDRVCA